MTILQLERFAQKFKVDPSSGCWVWKNVPSNGYGYFGINGRTHRSHRLLYQEFNGEIPASLVCDHLCRNKACCNPKHIEPVTQAVNVQRGDLAGRPLTPFCRHGHRLTPDNVYCAPSDGKRKCLECKRVLRKKQYQRFKQAKLEATQ
jgi:hypothetical protein